MVDASPAIGVIYPIPPPLQADQRPHRRFSPVREAVVEAAIGARPEKPLFFPGLAPRGTDSGVKKQPIAGFLQE
jgi:hypothetical protein